MYLPFCLPACLLPAAFMIVPFMSIVMGYNPVTITFRFVLASTIYFVGMAVSRPCLLNPRL
jgi:hypothetical protein